MRLTSSASPNETGVSLRLSSAAADIDVEPLAMASSPVESTYTGAVSARSSWLLRDAEASYVPDCEALVDDAGCSFTTFLVMVYL